MFGKAFFKGLGLLHSAAMLGHRRTSLAPFFHDSNLGGRFPVPGTNGEA